MFILFSDNSKAFFLQFLHCFCIFASYFNVDVFSYMRAFAFLLLWYFNTISKYFYCICKYEYLIKPLLNFSSSRSVSNISPRAKRAHCVDRAWNLASCKLAALIFTCILYYSYFEKGCRKKCTRQSRKVLWVVLSSLLKKVDRMAREAMDICLRVLKESDKSRFDSYNVRNSVLIISHITFWDYRVYISCDNLSRNSCISDGVRHDGQ